MRNAWRIYLSHRPNWIYFSLLGLGLAYILVTGSLLRFWYMVPVLLALTPFIEYFTHKYLLHMPRPADPAQHPRWAWLADRIHYLHHQNPKAVEHIFAELWLTLPMLVAYTLAVGLLSRSLGMSAVFITTLIAYFLFYEWTHLTAHLDGYTPRNRYARFLRKFHLWHHYKNEAHWYGITSPVADWVFLSWKNPHDVTPSELALRNRGRI